MAVGDFNGDGDPDLAVVNTGGSGNVSVLLGGPDGSFGAPTSFAAGNGPRSVAVGDFNGDGNPDLAVANVSSNDVSVLLNAPNDAPVAVGDTYSTAEGTTLQVAAPGGLGNDSDGDGDSLTAALVTAPTDGTLTLNADSFTYTPNGDFVGSDSFVYAASDGEASDEANVTITVTEAVPAECTLTGTAGNDTLRGTGGDDVICGLGGDDLLKAGGTGDDRVIGGAGNDSVEGGNGNDDVQGQSGNDLVAGGDGNDTVDGGSDDDRVLGGAGSDTVDGRAGDDRVEGRNGNDTVTGGPGADTLLGGGGNDNVDGADGMSGNDDLRGGIGTDLCSADPADTVASCP